MEKITCEIRGKHNFDWELIRFYFDEGNEHLNHSPDAINRVVRREVFIRRRTDKDSRIVNNYVYPNHEPFGAMKMKITLQTKGQNWVFTFQNAVFTDLNFLSSGNGQTTDTILIEFESYEAKKVAPIKAGK